MDAQYFVDLAADRHHRIERGHRFLEDHRHGGGAQLPQPPVARAKQLLADQPDAAAERRQRALLQQSHYRQRRDRFARSAFADQAQGFAFTHLQRDAVDDPRAPRILAEADDEVVDVEDDVWSCQVSHPSLRGAQATKQSILVARARNGLLRLPRNDGQYRAHLPPPAASGGIERVAGGVADQIDAQNRDRQHQTGQKISDGLIWKKARPSAMMLPQVGVSG